MSDMGSIKRRNIKRRLVSGAVVLGIAAATLPGAVSQTPAPAFYTVQPGVPLQFPVREGPASDEYMALEKSEGVGLTLPDYTLLDSGRRRVPLSQFRGRVLVLDFWGVGCGPCIRSLPHLASLAQSYRGQGVAFLSVCELNGDWKGSLRQAGQYRGSGLGFCFDPQARWNTLSENRSGKGLRDLLHNGMGSPTQIIVDRSGKVVGTLQGYDDARDPDMRRLQHSVDTALRLPPPASAVSRRGAL